MRDDVNRLAYPSHQIKIDTELAELLARCSLDLKISLQITNIQAL